MMQLVNNLQAATFALSFLITRRLMTESKAIYFLLRYISRSHNHKGFKASDDDSVCILCSLHVSLFLPTSLSLFSSHQLMLFWCIMLQPAPQIKSCLMILAQTSLKSVCLFARSPVTHLASQGGLPRGSRADLRHTPTHRSLHPTPPRQAWASQISLTIISTVWPAPTGPLQRLHTYTLSVSAHAYEYSLNVVVQHS